MFSANLGELVEALILSMSLSKMEERRDSEHIDWVTAIVDSKQEVLTALDNAVDTSIVEVCQNRGHFPNSLYKKIMQFRDSLGEHYGGSVEKSAENCETECMS